MRLLAYCSICPPDKKTKRLPSAVVDVTEDLEYEWVCPAGHKHELRLYNPHFELLFDAAALAILDGYYREAIINAASALERFHEFFIRFFCFVHKLEPETGATPTTAFKAVDAAWEKQLKHATERQFGAFVLAHLLDVGELPKTIPDALVKLRNQAVHQGRFVSRADAVKYVTAVHDNIVAHLVAANTRHPKLLSTSHTRRLHDSPSKGLNTGTHNHLTIIRMTNVGSDPNFATRTFEAALTEMARYRAGFYPQTR